MTTVYYQPKLPDRNRRIRKTIDMVRRKTRLDKTIIAERMLNFSADKIGEIFPELAQSAKNKKEA